MFKAIGIFRFPLTAAVECVKPIRNIVSAVTAELHPYKLFKLDEGPATYATCSREDGLHYYETMQRIRRMETTIGNLYKTKDIRGFCHLYSGQEAVAMGIEAALIPGDAIITAYRCHGFVLIRGESICSIVGELTGKSIGNVAGKGGSMHMYTNEFYGGNGIVGAQVPLGAGIALQKQRSGSNNVCVDMYGDGAANQGQVFEAFNMAKLWNLPCIFICENNRYAMGTSGKRGSANTAYYTRGDYIPGIWVDGMDMLTVREAMRFATDWCRSGKGPILLETETYRYYGHSMSDPGTSYRSRDEVQAVRRERDPIITMGHFLISNDLATEEEIKAIDKKIKLEVEEGVTKAQVSPIPKLETAYTNIYSKYPENFTIRGCDITEIIVPAA